QQLLYRAAAKAIDELSRRLHRHVAFGVSGAVDEGSSVYLVGHVAFFFQVSQNRADGGVLQVAPAGKAFATDLGGAFRICPDEVQQYLLQRRWGFASTVKHRNVRSCSTEGREMSTEKCGDPARARRCGAAAVNRGPAGREPDRFP